jgi:hypothetical protein
MQDYLDLGLNVDVAFNGVESGIYQMWQRLSTGKLKFFKSLVNTQKEYRLYRRDEKGRIVKENDHLMDVWRYGIMSGLERAITKPKEKKPSEEHRYSRHDNGGWMG